ncbi:MAG: T9SS type A sorting domain-containing protein [Flavobacteriales bacterium]|nr:T9SS type A sorting domain-containing protein [Flavobacteriales bacterium]
MLLWSTTSMAQVNYFQGWNTNGNLGDWTFGSGGVNNTQGPCEGSFGAHRSVGFQITSMTWTVTSPNLAPVGGNSGLPITTSFQFKRSASNNFNYLRSYWSTNGTTWTQVDHTVSDNNCNTYNMNFTPPAGTPIFIRLEMQRGASTSTTTRHYHFDAVNVQQAALECPAALFSISENCGNGTFQLVADVSTAGPSAQLLYSVNGVPQTPIAVTGPGVFSTLPIPVSAFVTYTLTNAQVGIGCSALSGDAYSTCPIILNCSEVLSIEYCYRNSDDRTWQFVNPSAGTVDVQFLSPSPIVSGDGINFYNGAPGVNQISVPPFGSDLSNIPLFTSPGSTFSIEVAANATGSCADGEANAPWIFEVKCTPDCMAPAADVNVLPSDCGNNTFMIELDLYDLGETNGSYNGTAGIRYSVNGGSPVDVLGLEEDIHQIGPFATTATVAITLLHEGDVLCNSFLGTFGRLTPCPPANDLCSNAQMLTVNAPGACMGAAVSGTTFDANNETTNPVCGAGGTYADVWYTFMSGWNQSPLTIGITAGTATNWGVQVLTACGGTSLACDANNPTSVSVDNLAVHTQYWIRVFTNTGLGNAGSFNICLSATPRANVCGTTVYDTGGAGGNYTNNQNYTVTYCSGTFGDLVTAAFTQFATESGYDFLYIYNGPSIASPLIGTYSGTTSPGTVSSSHPTGCLTFRFTSDFSNTAAGWTANLTCCTQPAAEVTAGVVQSPLCAGNTLELTASSPTATVFNWTGPQSFTSSAQNPSIANAQTIRSGTYSVIARNGPNGCPSPASTVSVSVVAPPVNVTASSSTAFLCPGNSIDLTSSTGSGPILLQSNFNSGAQGWTTLNQSTGGTTANAAWTLRPSPFTQGATFNSNDASQFYLSNSDAQGSGTTNASLTSPAFSTEGYTSLSLTFWHYYRHLNNQASVQVSTNGGSSWTTVQTYTTTQGASSSFVQASVSLSSYVGLPSVQVRFNHFCNFGWYWAIDNVTVSGTPVPVTYEWSSAPAGFSSTVQNPSGVVVNENTTYTVVVSSAPGCTNSANVSVATDVPLQANVTGPASFTYCFGTSSVNLSGSASGGGQPYTYEWINAANEVVGTGTDLVNFEPLGSTTISLRVTDACGTSIVVGNRNVTVNQLPNVQVTPNQVTNCSGATSTLVASGANTYSWEPAAGLSGTSGSSVIADPVQFITVYTVTGTDGNGCINTATAQVRVGTTPDQGTTTNRSICVNAPGQAMTATCPPFTASTGAAFPESNYPTNNWTLGNPGGIATAFQTVATVNVPALPPGATPVAARLVLNGIQALSPSYLSEIRVATTGVITLAETQISAVNASGSVSQVVIDIPAGSYPVGGGLVNLRLRETFNDGVTTLFGVEIADNLNPDGRVASASIEVDFGFPAVARWYDAPTGGNLVYSGTSFNPVAEGLVPTTADGFYSFWMACDGFDCESARTPGYFAVGSENVTLEFYTTQVPADVNWQIEDAETSALLYEGQGFMMPGDATFPWNYCLPNDRSYKLRVTDIGDGASGYQLRYTPTQARMIDNQDNLGIGTSEITGNAYSFSLPVSNNELIYTSCDKLWWRTNEYIVAAENAAVSALWIEGGANSVQSANTGYEFWFYNPNGGYSFRKFRPHNVSDGFGNVGATRACHLKVNNWAAANHIPQFDLMNVRVRSRVSGVNSGWGTACRFIRDEALAACPPTKLMDLPENQFLSCNQFRQFGVAGSRIHARPITGANLYQWRFRIEAENVEIIRTSTTVFLNLNWTALVAPPLENSKTYEVDVRASRDGGLTWCGYGGEPWGDICNLTIGTPPAVAGNQNMSLSADGALAMWPNPNNGTEVWISLEGIDANIETVTVDMHDLTGKRVSARILPTQDGSLLTALPLNGDLAAGIYMVTVTAGETQYVQRLVIQP